MFRFKQHGHFSMAATRKMNDLRIRNKSASWMSAFGLAIIGSMVSATTVAPIGVEAMSDHAGQVIVARVASARSYWATNPRRIETRIVLEDVEYLKGSNLSSTSRFTLIVPGGKVGDTEMRIMGAPTFQVGRRWLLFLLPKYKTFPVVGISAGAFRIETDTQGVDRVYGATGAAVMGIDEIGKIREAPWRTKDVDAFVVGTTSTVRLLRTSEGSAGATPPSANTDPFESTKTVSLAEFIRQLRPYLKNSRDHALTKPAGLRILVKYSPVLPAASRSVIQTPRNTPSASMTGNAPNARVLDLIKHVVEMPARPRPTNTAATRKRGGNR